MIVLQARAEGGRHRQPLSDIHGVVLFIVIAPVAKLACVRPVVLNHVHPQRKNPQPHPHGDRQRQPAHQLPQENKADHLRHDGKRRVRHHAKRRRFQNLVARHILLAAIRQQTEIQRAPETVAVKFVGIPIMVGIQMVQSMPADPCDRIHINPKKIIRDGNGLDEPFLIIQRTVRDAHMQHIGQIHPRQKPASHKINRAHQQPAPRPQPRRREIHTSQHVAHNNQIPADVVHFHGQFSA